jgi:hypothetical protein
MNTENFPVNKKKYRPVIKSTKWLSGIPHKELHDFYHALGVMHSYWNIAELQLQQICWFLIGAEVEAGRAITNELSNPARTNLILTLAREVIKINEVTVFFEKLVKLFDRNRINRNFVTHSRMMAVKGAKGANLAVFQPFSAKGKFVHTMYIAPLNRLRQLAEDIRLMNEFFSSFFSFLDAGGNIKEISSIKIPDLPKELRQELLSYEPKDVLRAKSSQRAKGKAVIR